jgi:hypothetical protein
MWKSVLITAVLSSAVQCLQLGQNGQTRLNGGSIINDSPGLPILKLDYAAYRAYSYNASTDVRYLIFQRARLTSATRFTCSRIYASRHRQLDGFDGRSLNPLSLNREFKRAITAHIAYKLRRLTHPPTSTKLRRRTVYSWMSMFLGRR